MTDPGHKDAIADMPAPPDPRVVVELRTMCGGLVARMKIPPMTPWPEAVLWGFRMFLIVDRFTPHDEIPAYREGIVWSVFTDEQGRQIL